MHMIFEGDRRGLPVGTSLSLFLNYVIIFQRNKSDSLCTEVAKLTWGRVTGIRLIAVPALAWSGDFNAGYDPDTGTLQYHYQSFF
jgi:hypothetical protein